MARVLEYKEFIYKVSANFPSYVVQRNNCFRNDTDQFDKNHTNDYCYSLNVTDAILINCVFCMQNY